MAQRAGGGVARIGEDLVAGGGLGFVESAEIIVAKVNLAADVDAIGDVLAFEDVRHVAHGADIGGDVLAFGAVAASGGGNERAVLVADGNGETVDLGFGGDGERLGVVEAEKAADAGAKPRPICLGLAVLAVGMSLVGGVVALGNWSGPGRPSGTGWVATAGFAC